MNFSELSKGELNQLGNEMNILLRKYHISEEYISGFWNTIKVGTKAIKRS